MAPSTDPAWTPLFLRAAAVVTEMGGYLSHGAIVAREYGIPAAANLPGLMSQFKTGEEILINGDTGEVTRLR
ncbi:MAG TPA: PEP-utilizing enzyme [Symbiobacteriaceae bacterium]|nr:PEP-utilizing enzyme [Symbiobacteriaceae bacterium]